MSGKIIAKISIDNWEWDTIVSITGNQSFVLIIPRPSNAIVHTRSVLGAYVFFDDLAH